MSDYRIPPEELRLASLRDELQWRVMPDDAVRARVAALDGHPFRVELGRLLAAGLRRFAPSRLGLLPPEFLAEGERR